MNRFLLNFSLLSQCFYVGTNTKFFLSYLLNNNNDRVEIKNNFVFLTIFTLLQSFRTLFGIFRTTRSRLRRRLRRSARLLKTTGDTHASDFASFEWENLVPCTRFFCFELDTPLVTLTTTDGPNEKRATELFERFKLARAKNAKRNNTTVAAGQHRLGFVNSERCTAHGGLEGFETARIFAQPSS